VRIAGIAACVPAGKVPNDPKVAAATGIPARLVAPDGVSALDLCLAAARRVLADTASRPEEFGAILAVSFTQRQRMPSLAAQAQARLGFPKDILAFDVLQACAGWGYGLYLASLLVRETGKKVLLLDGDRQSDFLDAHDPATAPLLSDGGTATVLEGRRDEGWGMRDEGWGMRDEGICPSRPSCPSRRPNDSSSIPPPFQFSFLTDGAKGDALTLEKGGTIKMDGFGVFRFVATDVVKFLKEFLGECAADETASPLGRREGRERQEGRETEFFVPHQPNVYLVRQLAKAVGLEDRVLISADRFGNLASASVPATIAAHAETLMSGDVPPRILFAGFGGGLAISVGLIALPADCRLSLAVIG